MAEIVSHAERTLVRCFISSISSSLDVKAGSALDEVLQDDSLYDCGPAMVELLWTQPEMHITPTRPQWSVLDAEEGDWIPLCWADLKGLVGDKGRPYLIRRVGDRSIIGGRYETVTMTRPNRVAANRYA